MTAVAARNALVGFKPTVGLVSRAGIVPESRHQDTPGVLARTVEDAAIALEGMLWLLFIEAESNKVISGVDERDPFTFNQPAGRQNYTQYLTTKDDLKTAEFGLPWEGLWNQPDVAHQLPDLLEFLEALKKAGATIVKNTNFKHAKELFPANGWGWQVDDYFHSIQYRIDVDFVK